jgi:YfiH family protein
MIRINSNLTDYFQFHLLSEQKNLKHFVSTNIKKENSSILHHFNISFNTKNTDSEVLRNREILAVETNISLSEFVMQEQIHSDNVRLIDSTFKGRGVYKREDALSDSDAMITNEKHICLFIFAADCVPVLLYDPVNKVIGAAHSGWKGTVSKIAQKTVIAMSEKFGTNPNHVIAGIGPSISVEHYEIGDEVANAVVNAFGTEKKFLKLNRTSGKFHFDIWFAVKHQLLEIGLKEEFIEISGLCSYNRSDLFFSARRQKNTGRFGAGIMMI